MSYQASLVQFLVDPGAEVDMQNRARLDNLVITKGIFMANARKEFPKAAVIVRKALVDKVRIAGNEGAPNCKIILAES